MGGLLALGLGAGGAGPAADGDHADALLAADVRAVGARVGETLLAVGALVRLLTWGWTDAKGLCLTLATWFSFSFMTAVFVRVGVLSSNR